MYNIHYHNFHHNYDNYDIRGRQELTTLFRTLSLKMNYDKIKRPCEEGGREVATLLTERLVTVHCSVTVLQCYSVTPQHSRNWL